MKKNILFENDKSTYVDEIYLILLVIVAIAAGVLLVIFKPSFWIVSSATTLTIGVFLLIIAAMYIPCIIYRLFHNDKK